MQEEIEFNENKSVWPFIKRIFAYTYHHEKFLLIRIVIFAGIVGIVDSFYPYIFSGFINECLVDKKIDSVKSVVEIFQQPSFQKYFWYLVASGLTISISVLVFVYSAGKASEKIIYHMRREMFEKLQTLPFSFFDKNSSGWLLSRISSDTDRVSEVISWGLVGMSWAIVSIFFCFGIMFYKHTEMTILVLISLPIMFIISVKIRALILKFSRESRKVYSEMIGLINEHIQGIELNKALANEDKAVDIFAKKSILQRKASFKSLFYGASYFPIVIIIGNLAAAAVLSYGSYSILNHISVISLGVLSSFFIYSIQIFEPIADITNYYSSAQNCLSAGERIFSLLDEKAEENSDLPDIGILKGRIDLRNIHFSYTSDKKILDNFSMSIPLGQNIALVGPTGGGKSTIASIISRFYTPQSGNIFVDHIIDVETRSLSSYRTQVGIVLQNPHIFSGSIAENVRFGNSDLTDEKIKAIFKEMSCDDLANRINESIQPDGTNLSVGEKQLISIARVFAYNPSILILDEATSAIDSITEKKLQIAVNKIMKGRTSIIIAHRLSTIINCDRILYIQDGKIIEDGSHSQLMSQKGAYWKLASGSVEL